MLKILPLGGMGNVTKNLFAYELDGKILIVDCGIGFPDENMPGVDLLIPDVSYLSDKKNNIVGMILTHGHDDHIGSLPYILPQLGDRFPIFASPLTAAFAESRLREFRNNAKISILDDNRPLRLGPYAIHAIKMTHSVPDTRHYVIETSVGVVYHGSDFKFDLTPVDGVRPDFQKIAQFGKSGVTILLSDSLRSEKEGFSLSESILTDTFEREIRGTKGKFVVTTMSSNVHRIQQAIMVAAAHGRKIAFIGRSIEQNIRDTQRLKMIQLPKNMIVDKRAIKNIPGKQLCLIIAGSQGQTGSSLVRAAEEAHDLVQLSAGDKVVFSSDPIPGNETAVYSTIDTLSRLGVEVIYSDVNDNLHVSGHASSGEMKLLMELVKPKFLVPIGGTYRHMIQYRKLAVEMGYAEKQVFLLESGQELQLSEDGQVQTGETIPLRNIMVDGLGIGDVGKIVLRDRQTMAKDGIVVVILTFEKNTGKLSGEVEIVSRGFVFVKESKALIDGAISEVQTVIGKHPPSTNWAEIKDHVSDILENYFYRQTKRSPMVLPMIIEV